MAYPHSFLRLVALGDIYSVETFSFSLSLSPVAPTEVPDDVPDGVMDAVETFFTSSGLISQRCRLQSLKLNEIGEDGRYVNNDTVQRSYDAPVPGASPANPPAQVALVVSLATALARGRGHAGRFYVPACALQVGTNGTTGSANALTVAQQAWTMLTAIETALPGYQVAVMSDIGAGKAVPVTAVRVGQVLDTIRSRRDKLPEEYVTFPIP